MNHEVDASDTIEAAPNFQRAIDTLSKLEKKIGPANLAYLITPNVILTLSGARGFCDGVFRPQNDEELHTWSQQIANSIDALRSTSDVYLYETSNGETPMTHEQVTGYNLVLTEGLSHALESTRLLGDRASDLIKEGGSGRELMDAMTILLKQNKQIAEFNLNDEQLGHVAFGILVGYPDKAILGSIHKWDEDPSQSDDPLINARVSGASYYNCPQPVYSYPRSIANDPDIIAHEQLWSSILEEFYASDFHKKLTENPEFNVKAKQLSL